MPDADRTALTYRYERWRALSAGILETAAATFLLLIAVRWFEAGALSKALVAAGGSGGLMLAPWLVTRVEALRWPVSVAASRLAMLGAVTFLFMALVPRLPVFVAGSMLAMTTSSVAIPLLTQIYQENYPAARRGKLFSRTFMIRIATAAGFSELAGRALSGQLEYFRWLLLVFAGAFVFAGFCLARVPSQPLAVSGGTHPFRALRFARDDKLFGRTLVMWMLMGFANLMVIPLRVEYLANEKYGVQWDGLPLTAAKIALFTGVIPNLARLVMSPVWGWLFDRMNFFTLRVALNAGFALGMLTFFATDDVLGLVAGATIYGVSNAGGDVAWSLWVTKFAPPERVADYMSVHTFFTGVRGVIAPVVSFQLAVWWSPQAISWLGVGMIILATLILIPEIPAGKRGRPAAALTEEVSE
jgi:hypothetical protein